MVRIYFALLLFGLSCLSWFAFYTRYFKWRDCFNELGRCFDEQTGTVYLEQSGIVWALPAALSLTAFLLLVWTLRKERDHTQS